MRKTSILIAVCLSTGLIASAVAPNGRLIIASAGKTDYQIVIPGKGKVPEINEWMQISANLIRDAFSANGFDIPIVKESGSDPSKPAFYLGDTKFAEAEGVHLSDLKDWSYVHKVAGKDLIIAGRDRAAPGSPDPGLGATLGTVKGVCDFLRQYAGTRFLYPGQTGTEFLKTELIAVPAVLDITWIPVLQYNYCLNWNTGVYEIANNMFPPATLPKEIVKSISSKSPESFVNDKDYKLLDHKTAYTYNWGSFHPLAYTPKSTARVTGAHMKRIIEAGITGIIRDGFGECFGLEGPVYYISGRLLDDPQNIDTKKILQLLSEFYTSAFGSASDPMERLYTTLFEGLDLYAEFLGIGRPGEFFTGRDGNQERYLNDPFHFLTFIYSAKFITTLETELELAKNLAGAEKVRQRLSLVSMELDYLKHMMTVIYAYASYRMQPDKQSWSSLLSLIDQWNGRIDSYYGSSGSMKTLQDWPELLPFRGDPRAKVGLKQDHYLAAYSKSPFAWDTKSLRNTLEY